MKKEEIPQDLGALGKITGEICYAVDESGKYTTALSNGWEVKSSALDEAWEDVNLSIEAAFEKLSVSRLKKYADLFEVSVEDLKKMHIHEA
jgi:hypothetical protein